MIAPTISRWPLTETSGSTATTTSPIPYRLALLAIAAVAAALNFVGLSAEGYDNEFYAAAVKSMSENWHNFFFNSFDPGGFVTIDKPPLGFWFQVASVKLFGFNGVAILLPEALAGVVSVLLLYVLVARRFGRVAGLVAALALAVTPISVVTDRNNTIDSILVLFVLAGAWAVLRAAESGKLRWLLVSALMVGLGFNIKMLEAFLVLPAFGLVYLVAARVSLRKRVAHLFLALIAVLAISLSWVTAVDLTPASQRPWVDSTTTNSELSLAIGYNGIQRLTGNSAVGSSGPGPAGGGSHTTSTGGQATGPGGGGNFGPGGIGENGPTGPLRLLDAQLGSQIGWLIPLSLFGLVAAAWEARRRRRDTEQWPASLLLWSVWFLTAGVFFSIALFYHTYYLVMLAPAVCALAGIAVTALWRVYTRPDSKAWWLLPLALLTTAAVQAHVLADYPSWSHWLTPAVVGACLVAALGLIVFRLRRMVRLPLFAGGAAVLALLGSPAAFAAYTTAHTQTGAILRAGPNSTAVTSGPGKAFAGAPGGFQNGFGGRFQGPQETSTTSVGASPSTPPSQKGTGIKPKTSGTASAPRTLAPPPTGDEGGPAGVPPNGSPEGFGPPPGSGEGESPAGFGIPPYGGKSRSPRATGARSESNILPPAKSKVRGTTGSVSTRRLPRISNGRSAAGFGGPAGGPGGQTSKALITYLERHRDGAKFLVATTSSNEAAPIIIATGDPVMSLGGFTGNDPILTTSRLAGLAKRGVVRYFLAGGGPGGGGGNNSLTTWIVAHSKLITVAGAELYEYAG